MSNPSDLVLLCDIIHDVLRMVASVDASRLIDHRHQWRHELVRACSLYNDYFSDAQLSQAENRVVMLSRLEGVAGRYPSSFTKLMPLWDSELENMMFYRLAITRLERKLEKE